MVKIRLKIDGLKKENEILFSKIIQERLNLNSFKLESDLKACTLWSVKDLSKQEIMLKIESLGFYIESYEKEIVA